MLILESELQTLLHFLRSLKCFLLRRWSTFTSTTTMLILKSDFFPPHEGTLSDNQCTTQAHLVPSLPAYSNLTMQFINPIPQEVVQYLERWGKPLHVQWWEIRRKSKRGICMWWKLCLPATLRRGLGLSGKATRLSIVLAVHVLPQS